MEISYYIKLLKNNFKWMLVLVVIASLLSVLSYDFLIPVKYESRAVLWVTKTRTTEPLLPVELSLGPQFIRDFKKLVKSDVFIGQVQAAVKSENPGFEKMDTDSFRKHLIFEIKADTRVFSIGFKADDPLTATLVALQIKQQFEDDLRKLFQIDNLMVVDNESMNAERVYLTTKEVIVLSVMVWSAAVLALVLFLDLFKKEADHEDLLDRS